MIATCFALLAFVAAVIVGFAAGNELSTIVWRASVVMGSCWMVGLLVGAVAQRTVEHHITQFKLDHPIPEAVSLEQLIARQEAEHARRTEQTRDTQEDSAAPPTASAAAA